MLREPDAVEALTDLCRAIEELSIKKEKKSKSKDKSKPKTDVQDPSQARDMKWRHDLTSTHHNPHCRC